MLDKVALVGTELGAAVSEACQCNSRRYALNKLTTARRHARELIYWFRLLAADDEAQNQPQYKPFIKEAQALLDELTVHCQQLTLDLGEPSQNA